MSAKTKSQQTRQAWTLRIGFLFLVGSALACNKKESETPRDAMNLDEAKERVGEMLSVVYDKKGRSRTPWTGWVEALRSGASLEGVYRGLVESQDYRHIENNRERISAAGFAFFYEQLVLFELGQNCLTPIAPQDAGPLAEPIEPEAVAEQPAKKKNCIPSSRKELSKLLAPFQESSYFTVKRFLSNYFLQKIDEMAVDPERVVRWYGRWASDLATRGVDFGLALRNRADPGFHETWALRELSKPLPLDSLRWEVLNRVHRMLNALQRR